MRTPEVGDVYALLHQPDSRFEVLAVNQSGYATIVVVGGGVWPVGEQFVDQRINGRDWVLVREAGDDDPHGVDKVDSKSEPAAEQDYEVVWSMPLSAKNPVDACQQALAILQDPENTATVFSATDVTGKKVYVDLEGNEPEVWDA